MRGHQVRSYCPTVTAGDRNGDAPSGASGAGQSPQYEIRVTGHLGSRWAAWFDGLSLTNEDDGTTVICGPVADQAALHGLLQKLRDIAVPLISVTEVNPDQRDEHFRGGERTNHPTDETAGRAPGPDLTEGRL